MSAKQLKMNDYFVTVFFFSPPSEGSGEAFL